VSNLSSLKEPKPLKREEGSWFVLDFVLWVNYYIIQSSVDPMGSFNTHLHNACITQYKLYKGSSHMSKNKEFSRVFVHIWRLEWKGPRGFAQLIITNHHRHTECSLLLIKGHPNTSRLSLQTLSRDMWIFIKGFYSIYWVIKSLPRPPWNLQVKSKLAFCPLDHFLSLKDLKGETIGGAAGGSFYTKNPRQHAATGQRWILEF